MGPEIADQKTDISSYGVHWEIPDFHYLSEKCHTEIVSSRLRFKDKDWKLVIYPNGSSWNNSLNWLGIAAFHENFCLDPHELIVTFSIIGKSREKLVSSVAEPKDLGSYCCYQLTPRSHLDSRKDKIVPGGTLNVFFTVENRAEASLGNSVEEINVEERIKELQIDFKKISLSGNNHDVVFLVRDQEFSAHKCVFASRSPVFLAMMTYEMKENTTGAIYIIDVDPKTFSDFLNYLYTGIVENSASVNWLKLYEIANKYGVTELKTICSDNMIRNISVDDFCDVSPVAFLHDEKDLKKACNEFYVKKSEEITFSSRWKTFVSCYPTIAREMRYRALGVSRR